MNARLRGRAMLGASAAEWALASRRSALITIQLPVAAIGQGAVVRRRGPGPVPPLRHTLLRALPEPTGDVSLFLVPPTDHRYPHRG
ncbi:hypothetical protein [Nonomuraea sp. SBT364]|uniref:hypothetical protein n=1 Tax=Nonomuraea sp. SBT364 TaxID=1580530 RepID=UPI00066E9156|nr:hypothetical protein [Nonomuraea sp. SBT364]